MLKDASRAGTPAPISLTGHLPDEDHVHLPQTPTSATCPRSVEATPKPADISKFGESLQVPGNKSPSPVSQRSSPSSTPEAADSPSGTPCATPRKRSAPLPRSLGPAPSKPIAAKDEVSVSVRGSSSLKATNTPAAATSASSPLMSPALPHATTTPSAPEANTSRQTVSSLLDQLTDIHDRQQKARSSEWDAFLRKRTRRNPTKGRREQDIGVGAALAIVIGNSGSQHKLAQDE